MKDDTQNCLAIEDDESALTCLKEVVSRAEGICRPKLVLLVQAECIPCKEEAARHANDIARGIVQKVMVDSPEGLEIVKKNDINSTPSLLLLDCHNKLIV